MELSLQQKMNFARLVGVVFWPAFLMACLASGFVFSLVDPAGLDILDARFSLNPQALYTLGFLLFWLLGCVASGITTILLLTSR